MCTLTRTLTNLSESETLTLTLTLPRRFCVSPPELKSRRAWYVKVVVMVIDGGAYGCGCGEGETGH